MLLHSLFDLLAVLTGALVYVRLPMPEGAAVSQPLRLDPLYPLALAAGALVGAYLFGSLNAWLSGASGIGRSIEGALAGAILAIEALKRRRGIVGSTGLRFAAPMAAAIAVGRIGCFLAGLQDMTHGTPTSLPWGHDFGDGIARHPVQLYESAAMATFLVAFIFLLRRRHPLAVKAGFHLFVGVYAGQRFVWEFLKPYGTVLGPFNLFHLLSIALVIYAVLFARKELQRA